MTVETVPESGARVASAQGAERFAELKKAFRAVTRDPNWLPKVLLGGFMLFLPILFLFSLGYTMEVLRRAKNDPDSFILPSWDFSHWPRYFYEGLVKFVIAIVVIIVPTLALAAAIAFPMGAVTGLGPFDALRAYAPIVATVLPLLNFVTLPFCAVACCRYLDSGKVSDEFHLATCWRIYRAGFKDFSLGAFILIGFLTVGQSLLITMPFVLFFGLCLVDNWFGPIYNVARDAAFPPAK